MQQSKILEPNSGSPWDALAGQYQLRPGRSPGVAGQRPVLGAGRLGRLLRGQRGEQVGRTLGSIFTLCAHAHRGAANLALAAAHSQVEVAPTAEQAAQLCIETARDHLRAIALEWPQRLATHGADAAAIGWLRECPLSLATGRPFTDANAAWHALRQLRSWLEARVLQQDIHHWLAAQREPDALAQWCNERADSLMPARCLSDGHALAHSMKPAARCLDVLDADPLLQRQQLKQLASGLVADADFVQRPTWLDRCAETGPWTRLRQRSLPTQHTAWARLSARWIELIEIAAIDLSAVSQSAMQFLATGALPLGDGQALAWSEMARGLLLHWVQLDAGGAVHDYRVLAPTEWNFHPNGALSLALTALPIGATVAAQTLAAAYDPCVACVIEPGDIP